MSSKVKLWLNLVAIILVFAIITISVGALFKKDNMFLSVPGTRPLTQDMTMDIEGSVNGKDFFTISFRDGKKDQNIENVPREEMTFTSDRTVITFDMTFKNLSGTKLYLQISGVYLDEVKFSEPRFTTMAFINNSGIDLQYDTNNLGLLGLELEPPTNDSLTPNEEDGSLIEVKFVYELKLFNRNISNETQDLLITISKDRFDI